MEEKNLDSQDPGAVSDTREPEVEKRRREYDHVGKEVVAPTREYSFNLRIIGVKRLLQF